MKKIKLNVIRTLVRHDAVYNGKCKLIVQDRNFMTEADVIACISELKHKKCEGFDQIRQTKNLTKYLTKWTPILCTHKVDTEDNVHGPSINAPKKFAYFFLKQ